jgi:hypothetical protein
LQAAAAKIGSVAARDFAEHAASSVQEFDSGGSQSAGDGSAIVIVDVAVVEIVDLTAQIQAPHSEIPHPQSQ